jgi:hypothetical protein
MSNQDNNDLSILDISLDDIEDLPGFEVPPEGEYVLQVTAATKTVSDKIAVEMAYEVKECTKKNNDTDPDPVVGTKFSVLYFLQGKPDSVKISKGRLKLLLAEIAEQTGEGNLLVLIRDHLAGAVVTATVKRRADKEDKERFFADVKNLRLV